MVQRGDMSDILNTRGYWPSFNRPYFLYKYMGFEDAAARYGDLFSYEKNPRANIFRRDAPGVNSIDSMEELIMSNSYKTDEFAYGYPGNTIGGRFDFMGGPLNNTPYDGWFKKGLHGARDGKVFSIKELNEGIDIGASVFAINGPPYNDQCAPFEFSGEYADVPHPGVPKKLMYKWQRFQHHANTNSFSWS